MQKEQVDIGPEILLELFYRMKKIRLVEETISKRYSEWKMRCPTHLSVGQEAVAAACGLALQSKDLAVSTHRSHAHYLGKRGDLGRMIAEIYGKETGCSGGYGGSMHLTDKSVGFIGSTAIVGNSIPVGVGLALAMKITKDPQISCVFLGDGAIEEGVFYESVNFAVLRSLPVLFVCENNLYSVYSPLSVRQPKGRSIHEMVAGLGIKAYCGDGNDPIETYLLLRKVVEEIRQTQCPAFVELSTYRWFEHCGPNMDNHIGYRSEGEFLEWKGKDPIAKLEKILLSNEITSLLGVKKIEIDLENEVNSAFHFAEISPFPDPKFIPDKIYSP